MRWMVALMLAWSCTIGTSAAQLVRRPVTAPTHVQVPPVRLDLDRLRKMATLRQWGLDHAVLGAPFLVTPQHPEIAGARISFVVGGAGTPTTDLSAAPYGRIVLPADRDSRIGVTLTSTNPQQWWLLDCYVQSAGATAYEAYTRLPDFPGDPIATSPPPPGSPDYGYWPGSKIMRNVLTRDDPNHVTVVFEPSTQTTRTFWIRSDPFDVGWSFGGCELTPFRVSE